MKQSTNLRKTMVVLMSTSATSKTRLNLSNWLSALMKKLEDLGLSRSYIDIEAMLQIR